MSESGAEKPTTGRLGGGIAALMSSNVIGAVLAFALSILIGRAAGESGLGIYAAAVAWVFPLAMLVDAGVGTLISRDLVYPNAPTSRAYVRAALVARLMMGVPAMLLLVAAAPVLAGSSEVRDGLLISAPLIVIIPLVGTFTAVFRARRRMRPAAMLNVGMLLSQVVLTIVVFNAGYGVTGALWVNVITSAGQLAAAYAIWRVSFAEPAGGDIVNVRDLLRRAFPFAVAAVIAAAQMRLNVVLLERVASAEQAGAYTAAARFVEAGRLVPQAVFDAMLPFLTLLVAQPVRFLNLMNTARRGLIAYGAVFGVFVWVFAYVLVGVFFGESFSSSPEVLRVLAWSLLPMSLKYLRGLYWYAHKYEGWVNRVSLIALAGQAAAALVVLPAYGALGAAWVALISEAVTAAVLWFVDPRETPQ